MSFVLTCCLVTQYLCHPVGGACVWRKGAGTRDLMLVMGTSMLTSSGFWAISQTTYSVLFSSHSRMQPSCSKQPSLLNKHCCVQFAVWGAWLCASWGWGSLTWQIYSKRNAYEKYVRFTSGYMVFVPRQQEVNIQIIIWKIITWKSAPWFNLFGNSLLSVYEYNRSLDI